MVVVNKRPAAVQQTRLSPGKAGKSIYSPNKPTNNTHRPCQTCSQAHGHLRVQWHSLHQWGRAHMCHLMSRTPSSLGHERMKFRQPSLAALILPTCRPSQPILSWCLGRSGGRRKLSCPSSTAPTAVSPAAGPVPLRREGQAHTHMAKLI